MLIRFSVGIGHNVAEAETALQTAKKRKNSGLEYNIAKYEGGVLEEKFDISPQLKERLDELRSYQEKGNKAGIKKWEKESIDELTGLSGPESYLMQNYKWIRPEDYEDRVVILLSGDDTKKANEEYGSKEVDRLLAICGRAIIGCTRNYDFTARGIGLVMDNERNNRSDRFIIDVECDYSAGISIAERILYNLYMSQESMVLFRGRKAEESGMKKIRKPLTRRVSYG